MIQLWLQSTPRWQMLCFAEWISPENVSLIIGIPSVFVSIVHPYSVLFPTPAAVNVPLTTLRPVSMLSTILCRKWRRERAVCAERDEPLTFPPGTAASGDFARRVSCSADRRRTAMFPSFNMAEHVLTSFNMGTWRTAMFPSFNRYLNITLIVLKSRHKLIHSWESGETSAINTCM